MPPELFATPVYDPRVDLYGAGATLFECLTSRPPHIADSLAELAHLRANVPAQPVVELRDDASLALAQVIDRCLAIEPEERYASASLAVWALDAPETEQAFAAYRSRHPLCVTCGEAISPMSSVCPSCETDGPFRYAAGTCHVVIDTVNEPQFFIDHVIEEVPEFCRPEYTRRLAERCAALSFAPQRYVSFVSEADANVIIAKLRDVNVNAHLERIRNPKFCLLYTSDAADE